MSRRDPIVRLNDMLDAARIAVRAGDKLDRDNLLEDELHALGVVKCLEIIGEAANHVDERTRSQLPGIPWQAVVALRHRVVHGYFELDVDVIWSVLVEELPHLIEQLETYLAKHDA